MSTKAASDAVLTMRGVSFGYHRDHPVLRDVSATLGPGRVCALLGPNAAGKSTMMKLALGLITATSGTIEIAGESIARMGEARRATLVSYVPQRGGSGFTYRVREVVSMGRFAMPRDESAVDRAIAECDLSHLAEDVFAELSIGQQQRVLLARAIAQSTPSGRLMLLDEPGSAMDLQHAHAMMALLKAQTSRGLAVLVVVHDLNLAARYADEVWLMHEGRIIASGAWQDVLTPAILEPVYRMKISRITAGESGRPTLVAEPIAG